MKIGLISDTHDYFDERLYLIFDGVNYIIHCGDITTMLIIKALEKIAPVIAVKGNNDYDVPFPKINIFELVGKKIFVKHKIKFDLTSKSYQKIIMESPDIVVYGHTHISNIFKDNNTLYINPGFSGFYRPFRKRTVGMLYLDGNEPRAEIIPL